MRSPAGWHLRANHQDWHGKALLGFAMSSTKAPSPALPALPTRTRVAPTARKSVASLRQHCAPGRPRVVRMPSDWWDAPTVEACPLSLGPQSARMARRFTRTTFADWGLGTLADDAEVIVGEFVANAVRHGARVEAGMPSSSGAGSSGAGSSGAGAFGLRLL